ncbi:MAG: T9SS type A sorting domain-containing protein, partial [Bacteroidota bacterium]
NIYVAAVRASLREIKSYHTIPSATEIRFAVYENPTATGTYTRIYDGPPITSGTGAQFFSSGPVNVQLDSGKYYMIGMGWQGSISYYSGGSRPAPVGFGQALSGGSISSYPPPATASVTATSSAFYFGAVATTSGKFISVTTMNGDTLGGGESTVHTVQIKTTYLEPGAHQAQLVVSSNDTARATVLVPVTVDVTTDVQGRGTEAVPGEFALHQNYPNPFNPATTIHFDLPSQGHVKLIVYDLLGREVRTLVNNELPAGYHSVAFDASRQVGMASGVYFYRLASQGYVVTRRMLLLR